MSVCMYVCDNGPALTTPTNFLIFGMKVGGPVVEKSDGARFFRKIQNWFFWEHLGPKMAQKWTLCQFSRKRCLRLFFILCIRIEDINTYQMAKTASKLIHFFRSYSPKTGLMTSSFGPKFNRDKNSMGQGHYTVILRWNGWELDVFIIKGSGKCGGFCICDIG